LIIPLSKPFKFEDRELKEIDLDLDNASGSTLRRADMAMQRMKHIAPFKQNDSVYCGIIAAIVTKIPFEVLEELPLADYNNIVMVVANFLLGGADPTAIPQELMLDAKFDASASVSPSTSPAPQ
jgi:hypothetical protein